MSKGTGRAEHSRLFRALLDSGLREAAERLGRDHRYRGKLMAQTMRALAQNMRLALENGRLTLDPPTVFAARGEKGAGRLMVVYAPQEVVLITAMHRLLAVHLDQKLLPQCIGFRCGFTRHCVRDALARARAERLHWVVVTDVAGYYASIRHAMLEEALGAPPFRLPRDVRALVMDVVRAGSGPGQELLPGHAPANHAANAYLHGTDEFLAAKGHVFCRFIDDSAVFVGTRRQAERALEDLRGYLLEARGLALSEPKTGIYHRYQQGFKFLGLRVIGDSAQPTPENAARFAEEIERYLRCGRRKALDEKVRAAPRAHLKERGGEPFVNARFRVPSRFPENLAYTNGELAALGLASLSRIKADYDRKTLAPQTGGL